MSPTTTITLTQLASQMHSDLHRLFLAILILFVGTAIIIGVLGDRK